MRTSVLVTRATFPDIADRLRQHFDVTDNLVAALGFGPQACNPLTPVNEVYSKATR